MADVSKLARNRLAQAPVAGPHPDADLLTGFAERTLPRREYDGVMAHLATCAECREVVALAAPEVVAAQPVVAPAPGKPKWLPWPVMRWGAVTAAVALVAVAVILESPKHQSTEQKMAELTRQREDKAFAPVPAGTLRAPAGKAEVAAEPQKAASDKSEAQPRRNAEVAKTKEEEKQADAVAVAQGAEASKTRKRDEGAALDSLAAAHSANAPVAAPPPPTSGLKDQKVPATVEVAAQAAPAEASNENTVSTAKLARSEAKPASKKPSSTDYEYDTTNGYVTGGSAGALAPAPAQVRPAAFRWTVTSDGRVQRSPDGRNWYFVQIAKDTRFRALTSDGPKVCAGGNNAALYYSADAGDSWRKLSIERMQGDIIRLVVNGSTLTITTSSGQSIDVHSDAWGVDQNPKPPGAR